MTKTEELRERLYTITRKIWDDGYQSRRNSVIEFKDGKSPLERISEQTDGILTACKDSGLHWEIDWIIEETQP